jgi:putative sporulation protein YyaC
MSLLSQISFKDPQAIPILGKQIKEQIDTFYPYSNLIILCIGTDRCTGDSLGPLVGSYLTEANLHRVHIWGTLEHPVHALNLAKTIQKLNAYPNSLVIAVDACLGMQDHIGDIQIVNGPLRPGTGVNKSLPAVGSFHIKGIVNVSGFLESMVLQNTRLYTVMQIAHIISGALQFALGKKT